MSDNISIPKRSIWSLVVVIVLGIFIYFQVVEYLIPGFKSIFASLKETTSRSDIGLIWVPMISYCLISLVVAFSWNIFRKVKPCNGIGLIMGLITGFIMGLITGLIIGLAMGHITAGLTMGLTASLMWSLYCGSVFEI